MDYLELGLKVKQLRKNKKVPQQQMAAHLGISRTTLSAFENGTSGDIGIKKVMFMLDYLGYQLQITEKASFPTFEELRDANRKQ